jgi:hypothetical protein
MKRDMTSPRCVAVAMYSSIGGFLGVFMFHIGLGIDNLGLRATSPIIGLIRKWLFPTSLVAIPLLLILGMTLAVLCLRRSNPQLKTRRKLIIVAVIGGLGLAHVILIFLFAAACANFL